MNEASAPGKRAPQNQKAKDGEFENTFRPKQSNINFGALKNEKAPKKKKKSRRKMRIVLLAVVVLIGAGAALYFTGFLNPVLKLVGLSDSSDSQLTLEEREAALDLRETALNDREESLSQREEAVAAKEAEQDTQDGSVSTDQTFAEMLGDLSDEELEYFKKVGIIYSKMDPAEAAAIMGSMYDLKQISAIIYYMQPAASALVLEKMEAATAANVTEFLLS